MKQYPNIIQQTPEWEYRRKGRVTGTGAKKLNGTPKARDEYFYEILAERLTEGVAEEYENPMDRGNRLEPEARAMFEFKYNLTVDTIGFCESDENEFIGFSGDGFIKDENGEYTKGLEIKCPEGKNYVKAWLKNEVPEEYNDQVNQAFLVNEKMELLYFVVYNPNIPAHPFHVIEVHRNDRVAQIELLRVKEVAFIQEINQALETLIKPL